MSIAPRNLVLAALVLALFALNALLDARHGFEPPRPLFAELDPARVARVRIARALPAQPGAKATQELVELERTQDGFGIVQCAGFPAHPGAVEDLLQRVGALRAGELLARNETGRGAYELGDNAPRLELLDEQGRALAALRQGRDARGASVVLPLLGSAHDGEVVSAPGLIALDARPEAWLDARVPLPELGTIERLWFQIAGEMQPTVIEREGPGQAWRGLDARAQGALDLLFAALEGLVVVRVGGLNSTEDATSGAPQPPDVELAMSGAGQTWFLEFQPLGSFETTELRAFECNSWKRNYLAFAPAASAAMVEQRMRALSEAAAAAQSGGGDPSNR